MKSSNLIRVPVVRALLLSLLFTFPSEPGAAGAELMHLYVSLGGENKIAIYRLNERSGELTAQGSIAVSGSPGALAVDPKRQFLHAAIRNQKSVATFRRDRASGALAPVSQVPVGENPVYLALDATGRYLLLASYGGDKVATFAIKADGSVGGEPVSLLDTGRNPHSIMPAPSNRFVFAPNTGADKILQYQFDAATGKLTPNTVPEVATGAGDGPRHFYFHPSKPLVYFVNEKGSSVTVFRLDAKKGTLNAIQTLPTLPADFTGRNTCAHIEITPSGKFLHASNRGHDSLAGYEIDANSGKLKSLGQTPTEKTPRSFNIDPTGQFLFAAGQNSDRLAAYRIDPNSGALQPLKVYAVGKGPAWVLVAPGNDE